MREIKFRAWYGEKIGMLEPRFNGFINEIFEERNGIYMQYTGLKDKNGTEIYEGDIVRFIYGEGPAVSTFDGGHDVIDAWSKEEVLEVIFQRGSFLIGNHLTWAIDEMEMDYSIEVIGNIHEHPHLLEEERT